MQTVLEEILEDAKKAYKESVTIDNELLEEYLLSIIGNAKLLINQVKEKGFMHKDMQEKNMLNSESTEIQKVHRRVPRWLNHPEQYNYKILTTYMRLSVNGKIPITLSSLESNSNIDGGKFMSHFNQMKIISEKNHAKVFEENSGNVYLWEPIKDFVIDLFERDTNV